MSIQDIKPFEQKIWLSSPTMHGEEQAFVKEGTTNQDAQNKLLAMFPKLRHINQKSYLKYQDVALICMQIYNLEF